MRCAPAWQERHDAVIAAGGLHIIGTERHESRRIDNQLRGRSGRQGDPGSSRFYLSMEDNLMRIFGDPARTKRWLQMAGMKAGEVIESGMLTRQIEKAQRKVEAHNFDIRKQLLLFDDVANDQRKVVYQQRTEILGTEDLSDAVLGMYEDSVRGLLDAHLPIGSAPQAWDLTALNEALQRDFGVSVDVAGWLAADPQLEDGRAAHARRAGGARQLPAEGGAHRRAELMRHVERDVVLRQLDQHWRDHLAAMDYLRQGIHLRGYAQKDYRYEYKREAFELFTAMLGRVKYDSRRDARARRDPHAGADRSRGGRAARTPDARAAGAARRGADRDSHRDARPGSGAAAGSGRGRSAARPSLVARRRAASSRRAVRARRSQGRAQRAVSVRLGTQVQAMPRCCSSLDKPTIRVVAAVIADRRAARAGRAAPRGQALAGQLGISGRQDRSGRARSRRAPSRIARGTRHPGRRRRGRPLR